MAEPRHSEKVLLIGGDGAIAVALAAALRARGDEVHCTTRRVERAAAWGWTYLDLADEGAARAHLPSVDVAFFCAAVARFGECRAWPEVARAVNVTQPVVLARRLVDVGSRVILLSTSAVLDCRSSRMPLDAPYGATSAYGRLKAEAETRFLELGRRAAVVRLTKVVTPGMALVERWLAALERGEPVEAFCDMRLAPITLELAVAGLLAAADGEEGGIHHVSGAGDITYAEFARHLARRVGVSVELVVDVSAADRGIPPGEITAYTSLETARTEAATGIGTPEPYAVIDEVFGPIIEAGRTRAASA